MEKNNDQGALQQPIGSGFNATSTASEVIKGIDLSGKTAIVTGGNAGIGLETTKVLAAAGATVIVPARDIEKAKKNLQGIANVEIAAMDLSHPDTIDAFAEQFLASGRALHLLVNNAGSCGYRYKETAVESNRNWLPITWASTSLWQGYGQHLRQPMGHVW